MRNMYFNGNINGVEMITDLEYWCLLQQRRKFCIKNHKPVFSITHADLMESYGFKSKDTNPKCCEGERENKIYYSCRGSVRFTQKKFKKFIVRMLFKKMNKTEGGKE